MCGRYLFLIEKNERLKELARLAEERLPKDVFEKLSLFEVYPGCLSLAGVYDPAKSRTVTRTMKWGFSSWNAKLIINARSETCFTSDFFKGARPCVLPASAYYEWSYDRKRYVFTTDEETFYLAGICRYEDNAMHFVILTETANADTSLIHHRQPVIFTYEKAKAWCASDTPSLLLKDSVSKRYFTKA